MTIRKSQRGRWMIDAHIRLPNGSVVRVRKVSPVRSKRGRFSEPDGRCEVEVQVHDDQPGLLQPSPA